MCDNGYVLADTLFQRACFLPASPSSMPSVSPAANGSTTDAPPERSPCQGLEKMARATGFVEDQSLALFYFTSRRAQVAALLL